MLYYHPPCLKNSFAGRIWTEANYLNVDSSCCFMRSGYSHSAGCRGSVSELKAARPCPSDRCTPPQRAVAALHRSATSPPPATSLHSAVAACSSSPSSLSRDREQGSESGESCAFIFITALHADRLLHTAKKVAWWGERKLTRRQEKRKGISGGADYARGSVTRFVIGPLTVVATHPLARAHGLLEAPRNEMAVGARKKRDRSTHGTGKGPRASVAASAAMFFVCRPLCFLSGAQVLAKYFFPFPKGGAGLYSVVGQGCLRGVPQSDAHFSGQWQCRSPVVLCCSSSSILPPALRIVRGRGFSTTRPATLSILDPAGRSGRACVARAVSVERGGTGERTVAAGTW